MTCVLSYRDICTDKKEQEARKYSKSKETSNSYNTPFTFVNIKDYKADR